MRPRLPRPRRTGGRGWSTGGGCSPAGHSPPPRSTPLRRSRPMTMSSPRPRARPKADMPPPLLSLMTSRSRPWLMRRARASSSSGPLESLAGQGARARLDSASEPVYSDPVLDAGPGAGMAADGSAGWATSGKETLREPAPERLDDAVPERRLPRRLGAGAGGAAAPGAAVVGGATAAGAATAWGPRAPGPASGRGPPPSPPLEDRSESASRSR